MNFDQANELNSILEDIRKELSIRNDLLREISRTLDDIKGGMP